MGCRNNNFKKEIKKKLEHEIILTKLNKMLLYTEQIKW